jgi:hypothetical protein
MKKSLRPRTGAARAALCPGKQSSIKRVVQLGRAVTRIWNGRWYRALCQTALLVQVNIFEAMSGTWAVFVSCGQPPTDDIFENCTG